jgi:hypothetical protein
MTCTTRFAAVPEHLGLAKQMFGMKALSMAFCPACAVLPLADLKQRIYARIGGWEIQVGEA